MEVRVTLYEHISENVWQSRLLVALIVLLFGASACFLQYSHVTDWPILLIVAAVSFKRILSAYLQGGRTILRRANARLASPKEYPHYINCVESLSIAAGLPRPEAYVINNSVPNAFSVGTNPNNASICVTTGLLKSLDRVELEGAVAHEMAHIAVHDIRLMTIIALISRTLKIATRHGVIDSMKSTLRQRLFQVLYGIAYVLLMIICASDNGFMGCISGTLALMGVFAVIWLVTVVPAYLMNCWRSALHEERDFLADANAVLLTRYPLGLAKALEKAKKYPRRFDGIEGSLLHYLVPQSTQPNRQQIGVPIIEDRILRLKKMIHRPESMEAY